MQLLILIMLLGIGLGFFALAWMMSESKRGGYAMLSGFVLILIAGLLTTAFGVNYKSGYQLNDNSTVTTVSYQYTNLTVLENFVVGTPLILGGFWGAIVVMLSMGEMKKDEKDET